jgi:hypothetical protein
MWELNYKSLYVELPGEGGHLFMLQRLEDDMLGSLSRIHHACDGRPLTLADAILLVRRFDLRLDFPCGGIAAKAKALALLREHAPQALPHLLEEAPFITGRADFLRPADDVARQIDGIRAQYPNKDAVLRFCDALEAAHTFFNRDFSLLTVHFTLTHAETSVSKEDNYIYVRVGRSPIWQASPDNTEARDMIEGFLSALGNNFLDVVSSRTGYARTLDAGQMLYALTALSELHEYIMLMVTAQDQDWVFRSRVFEHCRARFIDLVLVFFFLSGRRDKLNELLHHYLSKGADYQQVAVAETAIQFQDREIEELVHSYADRAVSRKVKRDILVKMAADGTEHAKGELAALVSTIARERLQTHYSGRRRVTVDYSGGAERIIADVDPRYFENSDEELEFILAVACGIGSREMVDILFRITADFHESHDQRRVAVENSMRDIVLEHEEMFAYLCEKVGGGTFHEQVVAIRVLAWSARHLYGVRQERQVSDFIEQMGEAVKEPQSYFLHFYALLAFETLRKHEWAEFVCGQIVSRTDTPWVVSEDMPEGALRNAQELAALAEPQRSFYVSLAEEVIEGLRHVRDRRGGGKLQRAGEATGAFFDFLKEMEACADVMDAEKKQKAMDSLPHIWIGAYAVFSAPSTYHADFCARCEEELLRFEGELREHYTDGMYSGFMFELLLYMWDNYEGTSEMTDSKRRRMEVYYRFLPVEDPPDNGLYLLFGLYAIRGLYLLSGHFDDEEIEQRARPRESLMRILQITASRRSGYIQFDDGRRELHFLDTIFEAAGMLAEIGFRFDDEMLELMRHAVGQLGFFSWSAPRILERIIRRNRELPDEPREEGDG